MRERFNQIILCTHRAKVYSTKQWLLVTVCSKYGKANFAHVPRWGVPTANGEVACSRAQDFFLPTCI